MIALVPWFQRFDLIFPRIRQPRESREAVNTSREAGRKKNRAKSQLTLYQSLLADVWMKTIDSTNSWKLTRLCQTSD